VHLNHNLHQVLLRNHIPTVHDLLQHTRQNRPLVHLQVDALELAQPDEVRSDEDTQVAALEFATLAVAGETGVLEADPELVHFDEVGQDETDRVV
jgi:hypothetical protein